MKWNGSLIIEEPGFPFLTFPHCEVLQHAQEVVEKFLSNLGYKFNCLPKLWEYVNKQSKFKINNVKFSQPILKTSKEKSLIWLSFFQIKDLLISYQVFSKKEFENILKELKNIAADAQYIATSLRLIQLHLIKK